MRREAWLLVSQEMWRFEHSLLAAPEGFAGVDEVGRGCLAGPVVAAAVILGGSAEDWVGVRDSKLLTKRQRGLMHRQILDNAIAVSVGSATVAEIDEWNILVASRIAMGRAILGLSVTPQTVLVDGPYEPIAPTYRGQAIPVVDGDAKLSLIHI